MLQAFLASMGTQGMPQQPCRLQEPPLLGEHQSVFLVLIFPRDCRSSCQG